jgi:hypothetical protein
MDPQPPPVQYVQLFLVPELPDCVYIALFGWIAIAKSAIVRNKQLWRHPQGRPPASGSRRQVYSEGIMCDTHQTKVCQTCPVIIVKIGHGWSVIRGRTIVYTHFEIGGLMHHQ